MLKNEDLLPANNQTKTRTSPGVPVEGADRQPAQPAVGPYPQGTRERVGAYGSAGEARMQEPLLSPPLTPARRRAGNPDAPTSE